MNIKDLSYRKVIEDFFKDCPKNITWYAEADWLKKTYSQEYLAEIFKFLYRDLCIVCDLDSNNIEADYLRDWLDPIWLAGNNNLMQEKIDEILKERGEI